MISIIIPVYNVAEYLDNCLQSIISQSYDDIEIILVNDGSTDSSREMCDGYANEYEYISVYHQENMGVSVARNNGIRNAKGNWITFIDGDDTICIDSLSQISERLITNADVYIFNSLCKGRKEYSFNSELHDIVISGKDLYLKYGYSRGSSCGCLYNRDFIIENQISFIEGVSNSEDAIFFATVLHYANKIQLFPINFYTVTVRENSASRSWDRNRLLKLIDNIVILEKELNRRNINYNSSLLFNGLFYSLVSYIYSLVVKYNFFDLTTKIKEQIEDSTLYPIKISKNKSFITKVNLLILNNSLLCFLTVKKLQNKISLIVRGTHKTK